METQVALIALAGPLTGRRIPLGAVVTVGRRADNTLPLDDAQLSRYHARFDYQSGTLTVTDLGSANGTQVNGQPVVGTRALQPGDEVRLGESVLRVEWAAAPAWNAPAGMPAVPVPIIVPPSNVPPARPARRSSLPLIFGGIAAALLLVCACGGVGLAVLARGEQATATPAPRATMDMGMSATTAPTKGAGAASQAPVATRSGVATSQAPVATRGAVATSQASSSAKSSGATGQSASPATGRYECYAYSDGRLVGRPGLNFSVTGSGKYTDSAGMSGTFDYDPGSRVLSFRSGSFSGQRAQYDDAHTPRTITFLSAQGDLGDSCDYVP